MNSQSNFIKFYNKIKFSQQDNNQYLNEKRDQLVNEIQRYLKEEGKPSIQVYNQGSYALDTGIKPLGKRDFDIDIALVFDLQTRDYNDPTDVKQWVVNAIRHYSHGQPEMRTPCVRVEFKKNGRVHYHVDLAIYGYCNNVKHIAKGRRGSQAQNKKWEPSEPVKLKQKLNKQFSNGAQRAQYKRIICYLKRWKDVHFKARTNEAPTGIALTVMAYQWFAPQVRKQKADDLKALYLFLEKCKQHQYGLGVKLPVRPQNALFTAINQSPKHREKYLKKMKQLCRIVKQAYQCSNVSEAAQLLRGQFGTDFPI
ncbi:MAG: nucleotidyltransferase [Aureispira sp.]